MGADLIIDSIPYPREGFEPNWDAGYALIKELDEKDMLDGEELESMESYLDEFKEAFIGHNRRDVCVHTIGSYDVFLTGGMSWGDQPTDMCSTISPLDEHGILEACGFWDGTGTNWKKLFELVWDKVTDETLPLLLGLDKQLDELVNKKLKGE